jgi:hypothetical protein
MRSIILLQLSALALAACHGPSPIEPPGDRCLQTYEFGNFGCARIVAVATLPPAPWPESYRYDVKVKSADPMLGSMAYYPGSTARDTIALTLTRFSPPAPAAGDTMSVWVVAKLLDQTNPIANEPLPVFAADSALRLVHFAAVGSTPVPDTVHLTLSRP